jgi:hypothetical protein
MAIAAIIYISISVLLVISAVIFFIKAIQSLMSKKQTLANPNDRVMFLDPNAKDPLVISTQREEIIAMLERQFASSPSSDS